TLAGYRCGACTRPSDLVIASLEWEGASSAEGLKLKRLQPPSPGGVRSSCESPEPVRPLWIRVHTPALQTALFHPDDWSGAQPSHDCPDIQLMHLGEPARSQLVIRVVPSSVVPGAQRN